MAARSLGEAVAIGVDVGGTQVRAALVDGGGRILAREDERTEATAGPERVLAQIKRLADGLLPSAGHRPVLGIGVSTPGPVDTIAGVARGIPTLSGFDQYPLKAELQTRFSLPVSLENDGIAAAIGEWRFGAGQGFDNLVYITVSTGIGGGVIADGRVLRGRMGMAGHIGHMRIVPDGARCPCGGRGCFEAYGSGTAFTARARNTMGQDAIDSRAVFTAARAGDGDANRLIDEEADILGRGIVNLLHVYSPDIVIMGGGMAQEFERLQPGMQGFIQQFAMPAFRDVKVVKAALGQNSGLVGSAALAFLEQELFP